MTVLVLTSHMDAGGIARYVLNLAKGLGQKGHSVYVASRGGDWERKLKEAGLKVIRIPLDTKSIASPKIWISFLTLIRFLKQTRVDLLHCHTRVTQFLGFLVWRAMKIPYVTTFHGHYRPHLGRRLVPCAGLRSIAISEAVKNHMRDDLKIPESGIRVIRTAIPGDDGHRAATAQEIRIRHKIGGSPVIGMIARFAKEKNHEVLIEAFDLFRKDYPEAQLVLAGHGDLEDNLKGIVKRKRLDDKVLFLSGLESVEIVPAFDVFVLPSIKEGLGISVLEAFSMSVPVIASDAGGLKEIVRHGVTGLVLNHSRDEREICEDLLRLMREDGLRARLVENAYTFVEKECSFDKWIERITGVYEEVVPQGVFA